jgi:urea transport system ATP-binding protein
VHVSFDGFKAINGLSLDIAPGELRCIIGPNGAGKTTMMDIITGKTRPDSGTVFFGSTIDLLRYRSPRSPPWALAASSRSPRCSSSSACSRTWSWRSRPTRALPPPCCSSSAARRRTALPRCCTPFIWQAASRQAGLLSHGQKQWLEIGMLLVQEPKLLLLDEPVAGMTDEETVRTAELFLTLKGKHSLMVVEHDMSFIDTISEKVTVLCDGSVLAEGTLAEVQADERVIEVYRR